MLKTATPPAGLYTAKARPANTWHRQNDQQLRTGPSAVQLSRPTDRRGFPDSNSVIYGLRPAVLRTPAARLPSRWGLPRKETKLRWGPAASAEPALLGPARQTPR